MAAQTRDILPQRMLGAPRVAFEIPIAAALALPWFAVLYRIFPSGFQPDPPLLPEPAPNGASTASFASPKTFALCHGAGRKPDMREQYFDQMTVPPGTVFNDYAAAGNYYGRKAETFFFLKPPSNVAAAVSRLRAFGGG